jgi:nucleoside-diphosphate-sugar epimerase
MFIADAQNVAGNRVFYYNQGTNARSWVHISDLASLYVKVVEAAVSESPTFSGPDKFPGYFFAGTQEHSHVEVAKTIGAILKRHGVLEDAEPIGVELQDIDKMAKHPLFPMLGRYLYASSSRTRPVRAEKAFGYKGQAPGLLESLEVDVLAALGK